MVKPVPRKSASSRSSSFIRASGDVRAVVRTLEGDARDVVVRALPRFRDRCAARDDAQYASAGRDEAAAVVTRRTVTITDDTAFVRVERADEPPSGFPGDFVERDLERWAVRAGDFVTVETTGEGARLVAARIAIVAIPAR